MAIILREVLAILTVDGTEQGYYDKFDDAIARLNIIPNSDEYLMVYKQASDLYIYILEQLNRNPYVQQYVMPGSIVGFMLDGSHMSVIIDYTPDLT